MNISATHTTDPSPPIITCSMIRVSFPLLTSNHHLPAPAAPTAHQTTSQPTQHYGLPSKRPPFLSNFSLLAILKATFAPPALITGCQDHHLHHHNHRRRPHRCHHHHYGFICHWLPGPAQPDLLQFFIFLVLPLLVKCITGKTVGQQLVLFRLMYVISSDIA